MLRYLHVYTVYGVGKFWNFFKKQGDIFYFLCDNFVWKSLKHSAAHLVKYLVDLRTFFRLQHDLAEVCTKCERYIGTEGGG